MSIVTLVSGGLDSSVMSLMIKEEGVIQHPLFIDYGQLGLKRELAACRHIVKKHGIPKPIVISVANWGKTVGSGITSASLRIFEDAFLPGRNMLFLLIAASYAYRVQASSVAIGLLSDETAIFPDQSRNFCDRMQEMLSLALDRKFSILTPLKNMVKRDVVQTAKLLGVKDTYSCHAGRVKPCGVCVACREYIGIEV
jgi:7-cyano-7-deazaguanine synthase